MINHLFLSTVTNESIFKSQSITDSFGTDSLSETSPEFSLTSQYSNNYRLIEFFTSLGFSAKLNVLLLPGLGSLYLSLGRGA